MTFNWVVCFVILLRKQITFIGICNNNALAARHVIHPPDPNSSSDVVQCMFAHARSFVDGCLPTPVGDMVTYPVETMFVTGGKEYWNNRHGLQQEDASE